MLGTGVNIGRSISEGVDLSMLLGVDARNPAPMHPENRSDGLAKLSQPIVRLPMMPAMAVDGYMIPARRQGGG